MTATDLKTFTAIRNACKLCSPLGASMVFRGIRGAMPLLHGSQGCSTYIRRYIISHFKEPMDVASSNFSEASAVFGGMENLKLALRNVVHQYHPELIGVATTCLSETMGENVPMMLKQISEDSGCRDLPPMVHVSTASYKGTHMDGFHNSVKAVAERFSEGGAKTKRVNLFPGLVSPADMRHLKEILRDFGLAFTMLPDYSDTLDSGAWELYHPIPEGGTTIEDLGKMGSAALTVEFGGTIGNMETAGKWLEQKWSVPKAGLGFPIGIRETDAFFGVLENVSGTETPSEHARTRLRLVDACIDAHKVLYGKRAVIYGDEDLVIGLASFLAEVGVVPVLCVSGAESGRLAENIFAAAPEIKGNISVVEGGDFMEIEESASKMSPDIVIGSSKGYPLARKLGIPLVRVGFPVHDRFGGQRILHVGYKGALELLDCVSNALLEHSQDHSSVGYMYM